MVGCAYVWSYIFRFQVILHPRSTQCRERILIVRIVGTRKIKTIRTWNPLATPAPMKLTHHKTFDVLDTRPLDRSAGKQDTDASPNEGQTAKGDWDEPI